MQDVCYGDTSLQDAASLNEWNATIRAFLAHGAATPTHLGAVLAANPDFAMAQALRGLFCMLLGRREMVAVAAEALALAKKGQAQYPRERALIKALDTWLKGHPTQSIAALEEILLANPADTMAMKLSQAIRFVMEGGGALTLRVQGSPFVFKPQQVPVKLRVTGPPIELLIRMESVEGRSKIMGKIRQPEPPVAPPKG